MSVQRFFRRPILRQLMSSDCKTNFMKSSFFSCALNKSKGVLILAKRKLTAKFGVSGADEHDRFCCVTDSINGLKACLSAIYAPNVFTRSFFDAVKSKLLEFCDCALFLGCDLNLVVPITDTSNPISSQRQLSSSYIKTLLEDLNIISIWCFFNPSVKDFTFFSSHHQSYSCIDYILASPLILKSVC